MLVTACLLAGVITQVKLWALLKSEGLLDMNDRIMNNNQNAVDYLNSLKDALMETVGASGDGDDPEHPYNIFIQAAREEAEFEGLEASIYAEPSPPAADAPAQPPAVAPAAEEAAAVEPAPAAGEP